MPVAGGGAYAREANIRQRVTKNLPMPFGNATSEALQEPLLLSDESDPVEMRNSASISIIIAPKEQAWKVGMQVFFPYIVAGLGMVFAGILLDIVQHWQVFVSISNLFILIPALLGLKGNLEMTLASRLSTQANLGHMDVAGEQRKMIVGNILLTQVQAIVVGFFASIVAIVLGWIPRGEIDVNYSLLLSCSSVVTASLASLFLGMIMVAVVLLSRRFKINPDNVATPIAASLGDLTTLCLLSVIASFLFSYLGHNHWVAPSILVFFLLIAPIYAYISHHNSYVHDVLYDGWTPVIGAMAISSIGGLILDSAVTRFAGIAVFQPVINGVGGNLVAVHASRLSTSLHRQGTPGNMPDDAPSNCINPCSAFFGSSNSAMTARVLMLLVIPGHLLFVYVISLLNAGHDEITFHFLLFYLLAGLIQVAILLYVANWLVHYLWRHGNDPDNFSIPYLTALGDLLGTGLLAITFCLLYELGNRPKPGH